MTKYGLLFRSDELVTPIHISVIWGKHRVLKLLLKRGGDPTIKDEVRIDVKRPGLSICRVEISDKFVGIDFW